MPPLATVGRDGAAHFGLRVIPRARRARIDGAVPDADGNPILKVTVTAAPEDGKANAAVIALLAEALGVPRGRLAIVAGGTARRKLVRLEAASPDELARLAALGQEKEESR